MIPYQPFCPWASGVSLLLAAEWMVGISPIACFLSVPGVSMTLKKWVNDPIILGDDQPFFKGHGSSRYTPFGRQTETTVNPKPMLELRCQLWRHPHLCNTPKKEVCFIPGVSMTLKKWLVITQNNGVVDPFLKGHGDSRYLFANC